MLARLGADFSGAMGFLLHGMMTAPFWLAAAGVGTAYYLYMLRPELPGRIKDKFQWVYNLLDRKYGFDDFNDSVFAGGGAPPGARCGRWAT